MKRTVPLVITAVGGLVLIVANFSPHTESWGEATAIWFDILAAIAFVLGGANLLKTHLKKISDRRAGWAYSLVTVIAFLTTLYVGIVKWGSPPAPIQEFFGESFAPLEVSDFPLEFSAAGAIPPREDGQPLPASARDQLRATNGKLVFRGWMDAQQVTDLKLYKDNLAWHALVEDLADVAQPPESLRGKVLYHADHRALGFRGRMTAEDRAALEQLDASPTWRNAIGALFEQSQRVTESQAALAAPGFDTQRAARVSKDLAFDAPTKTLRLVGPLSRAQRDALARQFPIARPLSKQARQALLDNLARLGELSRDQMAEAEKMLALGWTLEQLTRAVDLACSKDEVLDKSARELLADQQQGQTEIVPTKAGEPSVKLTAAQKAALKKFAADEDQMLDDFLAQMGPEIAFTARQRGALAAFLQKTVTRGTRLKDLCIELMRAGPLNDAQRDFLLAEYRVEVAWRAAVGRLFVAAHTVKFPWSGEYRGQGTPFWWLYEYAFKPIGATMFSLLAFYVASAAFRAFRAKNLEASLLLATALIILLGRTFAGALATNWLPPWLSVFRVDSLEFIIMKIFNTAGTRAVTIGIALGIASTSLKVLLGIDRSYLGSGKD